MKKLFNANSSNPQKAFTLLELLVVIAVLGILAVAIITALNPVKKTNQAKDSNVKSDINQIANALQAFLTSKNPPVYPATLEGLVPDEIKTLHKQQAGATLCASISPSGAQGAQANYCYGTNAAFDKAVVWGFLFDVAVNPSTTYYCWDSSSGIFKTSAVGALQPSDPNYQCL